MPTQTQPIIRVENLTAAYGDDVILNALSFDVRRGEVFVILGGSGCGKSTLLKHMIGLYAPVEGSIWIDGQDITQTHGEALQALRQRFGVAYQSGALFGSLTLIENVRLPLEEYTSLPSSAIDTVARAKLESVGLENFPDHMPSELSGGMQKRAAIARAMALDPEVLFLDEPSAGLDPVTSAGLDALVLRLARSLGVTFVIVSHELPSIFSIADRCIMLDRTTKGIAAVGRPTELRDASDNAEVRRFFNRQSEEND